ncbi:MAG: hypothetical protein U0790_16895 [Isosphaeraceae bacterium]
MATKDPEKSVDVPPTGSRNPDPITDAPGSHPVETGIGAAIGGAASGAAVGTVAGPVGTAIGAAVGAIAGGLAGKGIGELIDPTTQDNWLRDNFSSRSYARSGRTYDDYVPAYRYGGEVESQYSGRDFDDLESDLERDWTTRQHQTGMSWSDAKPAVRDAYDRTCQIRKQRQSVKQS